MSASVLPDQPKNTAATGATTPSSATDIRLRGQAKTWGILPQAMLGGFATAVGVFAILLPRVPMALLGTWFAARVIMSLMWLGYSLTYQRFEWPDRTHRQVFRVGVLIDGVIWSALGWGLTPAHNLEVAIVSAGVLMAAVALAGTVLYMELVSARIFIVTLLVPNAFFSLTRQDDLGVFCCFAFLFASGMFMAEAKRTNRRILELQRLRQQADKTVQAQAIALEEAKSLSEMKSRFVATMSHEMRTPVHGILGLLRMARERVSDPEAQRQLELIKRSGEHLVGVINDVLDFSKMEASTLPLHAQAFSLQELIEEVSETWAINCQQTGLRFALDYSAQANGTVSGDPMRIRQVLDNLIGNAVKFTGEGGHVTLSVRPANDDSDTLTFHVQDSGIGIPSEEIHKIFQPFQQAEGTYQRRFGGTGLGLTISRELCVAMGGDLHCQSTVGVGSVFWFSLPLPPAQTATQAPPQGDTAGNAAPDASETRSWHGMLGEAPHVLLVEDNAVNAIVAEAELRRLGIRVSIRHNGREAIEWLSREHADLVLMDCDMPEMDGIEATRRIREHERQTGRPAVTIIALTAHGPEVFAQQRQDAGMNDHLAKPFTGEDLSKALARHASRTCLTAMA